MKKNDYFRPMIKGIYQYTISPFYQVPFAGYLKEWIHIFKSHYKGTILFCGMLTGGWLITHWAHAEYHRLNFKHIPDYKP